MGERPRGSLLLIGPGIDFSRQVPSWDHLRKMENPGTPLRRVPLGVLATHPYPPSDIALVDCGEVGRYSRSSPVLGVPYENQPGDLGPKNWVSGWVPLTASHDNDVCGVIHDGYSVHQSWPISSHSQMNKRRSKSSNCTALLLVIWGMVHRIVDSFVLTQAQGRWNCLPNVAECGLKWRTSCRPYGFNKNTQFFFF